MDKVNIDKTWLPKKLREFADRLDEDYWSNVSKVLADMKLQYEMALSKMNTLSFEMLGKMLSEHMKAKETPNEMKE